MKPIQISQVVVYLDLSRITLRQILLYLSGKLNLGRIESTQGDFARTPICESVQIHRIDLQGVQQMASDERRAGKERRQEGNRRQVSEKPPDAPERRTRKVRRTWKDRRSSPQ
ncbi:MAG: hypothetical protein OEQ39_03370 [Gammaproteobacteria bacterium]|nr:hypothetical protein [Gammaproteobacteria bacterium]MDH3469056.1 hypothetical protein [Gammaproteobacteria bacterium]